MVEGVMSRRFWPTEQRKSYQLGCWFDAVIRDRVADHRQFLESRNAANCLGHFSIPRNPSWGELRREPDDDEE